MAQSTHVALGLERQIEDADPGGYALQGACNGLAMLAAGMVVIWENDYIGAAQMCGMLGSPLPGPFGITGRVEIPGGERIHLALALDNEDLPLVCDRLEQLRQPIRHAFLGGREVLALATGGQRGPACFVEAIPVLAGRLAHVLVAREPPDPLFRILGICSPLAKGLVGFAACIVEMKAMNLKQQSTFGIRVVVRGDELGLVGCAARSLRTVSLVARLGCTVSSRSLAGEYCHRLVEFTAVEVLY